MGRYRSRPIEVEAFRFTGETMTAPSVPDWFVTAVLSGVVKAAPDHVAIAMPSRTECRAGVGDWIVREYDGAITCFYPAMFTALYEPADAATAIAHNQIVTPAQLPGRDEHTLERLDDAEATDYAGPPVAIAPYKRPADKRVKALLDDAARNRAAEGERAAPRELFSDPRLDPHYKPPKKPQSR